MAENEKEKLLNAIQLRLNIQVKTAQTAIDAAKDSKNNETKSTAGDKFETGRAMMQLEQEKNEMQLQKTLHLKNQLHQIDVSTRFDKVRSGSLVIVNDENTLLQ